MLDHRAFKDAVNAQFASIAKALANPHRFEMIDLLAQGERSVEEIAAETDLSLANASQHLQALREARLVTTHKQGLYVYYSLSDPTVFKLVQTIRETAEQQMAEVERIVDAYLHDRESLDPMSLDELRSHIAEKDLVVLDVRPAVEYQQGHIAGALSIPIDELENRLGELPADVAIVAYCRGPYCVFSDEAVQLLTARGYHVRRLRDGYPAWQLTGLPVERA
jgi:rhodanese-related sulfurtransferase/predicted transcriptional regulator